ncbi:MAG: hypothetical protein ACLFTT_17820, partial [Candidatus Hydrogenedentota bacterium]
WAYLVIIAALVGLAIAFWPWVEAFVRAWIQPVRYNLRWYLPIAGIVFALALVLVWRPKLAFLRGLIILPLCFVAIVSAWHYGGFCPVISSYYFDDYEFYHYYIGAKYAPEAGYTEMYNASIVADAELGGLDYDKRQIRNLSFDMQDQARSAERIAEEGRPVRPYRDVKEVLEPEEKARIKGLFSEERWEEFVKDIKFFKGHLRSSWHGILRDKGYNATPVWSTTGGLLSNAVSTDSKAGMQLLALLDPILLVIAFILLLWAYGPATALLCALFFGANFLMMQSPTMKHAFLRMDWIALTLMSTALVRKRWYVPAGVLMAYAFLTRMFPIVFVFGLGARGLYVLLRTRRLPRRYWVFGFSFAAACAVFILGSIIYAGGLWQWRGFFDKIGYHNADISTWRIGFKFLFMQTYDLVPPGTSWWEYKINLQQYMRDYAAVWWGIQGAVLFLSFFLLRRLRDDEALPYSFVPVFFLVAPTHYYYAMLVIPFLFFAIRPGQPLRTVGMVLLFAICLVGWNYHGMGWKFPLSFDMSAMLFVFVLYMMFTSWIEGRLVGIARRHGEEEPPDYAPDPA